MKYAKKNVDSWLFFTYPDLSRLFLTISNNRLFIPTHHDCIYPAKLHIFYHGMPWTYCGHRSQTSSLVPMTTLQFNDSNLIIGSKWDDVASTHGPDSNGYNLEPLQDDKQHPLSQSCTQFVIILVILNALHKQVLQSIHAAHQGCTGVKEREKSSEIWYSWDQ